MLQIRSYCLDASSDLDCQVVRLFAMQCRWAILVCRGKFEMRAKPCSAAEVSVIDF